MVTPPAALVTGGDSGIGAAIVGRLVADGYRVMVGAETIERARRVEERTGSDGAIAAQAADLTEPGAPAALVDGCVDRFGRIDVLVNNAAVTGPPARVALEDCTDDQFDHIISVNLGAAFRCARAAVPHMRALGRGVIVNIGSVAAFAAQRNTPAYAASKAGLLGLTRGLAFDLAADGIRVVFVAPGDIALDRDIESEPPSAGQAFTRMTPLGRRGQPADVAGVVAYACSADAAFVTGTSIAVDGGWLSY